MLKRDQLMELHRELKAKKVLSIYVDADQNDPAERNKWRTRLERDVNLKKKDLEGNDEERRAFEQAWSLLKERLDHFESFLPGKGWVGFATPDKVWYAESVPADMPDTLHWEDGMRVAPYVRGLEMERTALTVLVDSQRARMLRYQSGEMTELEDVRADTFMGDINDIGMSKRATTHSGVIGQTSTDLAQRILDVSTERMLKFLMEKISHEVGADGFLVLGGVSEVVARAVHGLPKGLAGRAIEATALHVDMTLADIKTEVQAAASQLTQRYQGELLAQVVDAARAKGKGCLGGAETQGALTEMRVDTLLLSRTFVRAQPDASEQYVGEALAQDAAVEELSEEAGARLDREGGGIGARLRYRVRVKSVAAGD